MATSRRKKWPEIAEGARLDSVSLFLDIQSLAQDAAMAIANGDNRRAARILANINNKAKLGQRILNKAKEK